jgi:uncharacterized protein
MTAPPVTAVAEDLDPHDPAPVETRWAVLILTGAVAGVLSGLFAVGGAIVMVPLLVWRAGMDHRRAAATSLVAIIPTAVVSSATYLLHADVDVVAAGMISVGAIGGAVVGSRLLRRLPMTLLRWLFIGFIVLIAVHLLVSLSETAAAQPFSASTAWSAAGYIALGFLTGVASGLFGIGGAILTVPALGSLFAFGDAVAKGTALLVSIPTSLAGTVSNRRAGGSTAVDVRAGIVLGITASALSVPAVYLSVALPPSVSSISFAALLMVIAVQLGVTALRAGRDPEPHRIHPPATSSVEPVM